MNLNGVLLCSLTIANGWFVSAPEVEVSDTNLQIPIPPGKSATRRWIKSIQTDGLTTGRRELDLGSPVDVASSSDIVSCIQVREEYRDVKGCQRRLKYGVEKV